MKIQTKTSNFSSTPYYESEDGRAFRRIAGGVAWPFGDQAGVVLVVGEDLDEDMDHGARHLRVLAEVREHLGLSFVELRPMLACMAELRRTMQARPWYGELGPWGRIVSEFNGAQAKLRQPTVAVYPPPGKMDFAFHAGLVRRRVMHEKTLHLGQGALGAKLGLLPADLTGETHAPHPEAAALFYAVAGLDLTTRTATSLPERKHGMADRAGGY